MPGYERSRIVGIDQIQLEELTCGVCLNVLCRPVVTACCGQSYCKDCIDEWLRDHNTCPNDRRPLTSAGLSDAPRMATNFLDKLKIRCDHFASGCLADIRIGQLADHVSHCPFNKCTRCSYIGPVVGHDCVQHLLNKVKNLEEQVAKLSVEEDNTNGFISAIKAAKGMNFEIVDRKNVPHDLARLIGVKCKHLLAKFNPSTNDGIYFCNQLADILNDISGKTSDYKSWSVNIYVDNYAVCLSMVDMGRIALKFGDLVIVVSNQKRLGI